MRARLALTIARQQFVIREISLQNKPDEMLALSAKATVPVLLLPDGRVLDESMDIARWTLERGDPQNWLIPQNGSLQDMLELISNNDGSFKHHLDHYKYATRYDEDTDPTHHRGEGVVFLNILNDRLNNHAQLFGDKPTLADYAIFPFVRQFANADRAWFDAQPLTKLQSWLAEHINGDLFQQIMQKIPLYTPGDKQVLFPI